EAAGLGLWPPLPFEIEGRGVVPAPPPPPGTEGQRFVVRFPTPFPVGGWLMLSMIIYQPALDHLTSELQLDASQQAAVKELMVERRTELLALIDKSPPPTLGFGDALP